MKHKIRYVLLHAHYRRKMLFWGILGLSTLFFGLLWLLLSSGASIEHKQAEMTDSVAIINNQIGNITISDDPSLAILELSSYIDRLSAVQQSIEDTNPLPSASITEQLFHSGDDSVLSETRISISKRYEETTSQLEVISYTLTTTQKFLNYAPLEDFTAFGEDIAQDTERIARTQQAFAEISSDSALNEEFRSQVTSSSNLLENLESRDDLEVFNQSVLKAKRILLSNVASSYDSLKSDFADFHNNLLYQ